MLGHCSRIFAGQLSDLYANYFSPPESLSERARTSVNHLYQTLPSINDCRNLSLHLFAHYLLFSAAPATLAGMSVVALLYDRQLHADIEANRCTSLSNVDWVIYIIIGIASIALELSMHPIDRVDQRIDEQFGCYIPTGNCKKILLGWLTAKCIKSLQYSIPFTCSPKKIGESHLDVFLYGTTMTALIFLVFSKSQHLMQNCFQEWKKQHGAYHSNIAWMREIGWVRDDA